MIFPLASVSRPALGTTQTPLQWVPGVLSPGHDSDHSPHLVSMLRMSRSYTSHPKRHMACSSTALALNKAQIWVVVPLEKIVDVFTV
jgi:hypothetical protein